jgi:hypothetical protein
MASVPISRALKAEIEKNILAPFHTAYREANKATEEDSLILYRKYMVTDEQEKMLKALSEKWISLNVSSGASINLKVVDPNNRHWLLLKLPLDEVYYSYSWSSSEYTPSTHLNNGKDSWCHVNLANEQLSTNYLAKLEKINSELDTFRKTVLTIVDKCKTLNQVHEIWPAITKYVSNEYVQRMHAKRGKRTLQDVGLDPDELTSISVQHIKHQMTV